MSYFNKYTTISVEIPKIIGGGWAGHFKFETFKAVEFPKGSGIAFEIAGTRRVRAEFDNIITNQGFNYLSTLGNVMTEVAVGTGTTPETATDTALETFVAGTANDTTDTFGAQGSAPYYGDKTLVWRFGEGVAAGNLSEAGIGRSSTNVDGTDLWSRALIKDGLGAPTTITVLGDEWLDVSYQARLYPGHLGDATGSVLISGASHDYVMRNAIVTSAGAWGAYLASKFPLNDGATPIGAGSVYESGSTLGAVTSSPSGSLDQFVGRVAGSYSTDTYNQDCTWNLGLNDGNWAGGFECMAFSTSVGVIQMSLDPVVLKTDQKVFDFTVNWDWGNRVVIP